MSRLVAERAAGLASPEGRRGLGVKEVHPRVGTSGASASAAEGRPHVTRSPCSLPRGRLCSPTSRDGTVRRGTGSWRAELRPSASAVGAAPLSAGGALGGEHTGHKDSEAEPSTEADGRSRPVSHVLSL